MFGKNIVTSKFQRADGSLLVNDCYYTLQGEGPDAGYPAVFLRLAKCNLRCYFCDTEFETGVNHRLHAILDTIKKYHCDLCVITGGEPLLQNIIPLVHLLNTHEIAVSIETAGTVWLEHLDEYFAPDRSIGDNLIVCSPKTPLLEPQLVPIIGALKYIIRAGETSSSDGLPMGSTQLPDKIVPVYRPEDGRDVPVYVQPMDTGNPERNDANLKECTRICLKYGYRLSVQIHKIANLP